jgi:hypothetical protein
MKNLKKVIIFFYICPKEITMLDLNLGVSIPNTELKKIVGHEKFAQLTKDACDLHDNTCQCCGWKPKTEDGEDDGQFEYKKRHLVLQVLNLSEDKPEFSETTVLCRSCYVINHIDIGIEHNMVELVNARVTQQDLIKMCWSDVSKGQILGHNRAKAESDKVLMKLKGDPLEFVEKFKNGLVSKTIKVIFTDSFLKR